MTLFCSCCAVFHVHSFFWWSVSFWLIFQLIHYWFSRSLYFTPVVSCFTWSPMCISYTSLLLCKFSSTTTRFLTCFMFILFTPLCVWVISFHISFVWVILFHIPIIWVILFHILVWIILLHISFEWVILFPIFFVWIILFHIFFVWIILFHISSVWVISFHISFVWDSLFHISFVWVISFHNSRCESFCFTSPLCESFWFTRLTYRVSKNVLYPKMQNFKNFYYTKDNRIWYFDLFKW